MSDRLTPDQRAEIRYRMGIRRDCHGNTREQLDAEALLNEVERLTEERDEARRQRDLLLETIRDVADDLVHCWGWPGDRGLAQRLTDAADEAEDGPEQHTGTRTYHDLLDYTADWTDTAEETS